MPDKNVKIIIETDGVQKVVTNINEIRTAMGRMSNEHTESSGRMAKSTNMVAEGFGRLQDAIAGIAIGSLVKQFIEAGLAMEKFSSQYKAIFGSSETGAKEMAFVSEVAKKLGLDLKSTAESYGKFSAAARGSALEGQTARDVFKGLAIGMTALKLGPEEASRSFAQLQQMMSKGVVQQEEMRTLSESLPGAYQMVAKSMGITTAELSKLMQDGKVMSSDMLPQLASSMENTFGKVAVEAATKGQGAINSFKTALFEVSSAFGTAILPTFITILNGLKPILEKFKEFIGGIEIMAARAAGIPDAVKAWFSTKFNFTNSGQENNRQYAAKIAEIDKNTDAVIADILAKYSSPDSSKSAAEIAAEKERNAERARQEKAAAAAKAAAKAAADAKIKANQEAADRYQLVARDMEREEKARLKDQLAEQERMIAADAAWRSQMVAERVEEEKRAADAILKKNQEISDEMQMIVRDMNRDAEAQKKAFDQSAYGGMMNAMKEFGDKAKDTGDQVKTAMLSAFQSIENALVDLVMTGKIGFKSLVNSIIADFARIQIKQQIMQPITSMLGSGSGFNLSSMVPGIMSMFSSSPASPASYSALSSMITPSVLQSQAPFSMGLELAPSVGPTIANATQIGASAGISSGLSAGLPGLGAALAIGMTAGSYFKSGGLWHQSTDAQRGWRGATMGAAGVGGAIGLSMAANAGLMGTSSAALSMAGLAPMLGPIGLAIGAIGVVALGLDKLTKGGLFGTAWKNKESGIQLGIENGNIDGTFYTKDTRKRSLWRGTKTRYEYTELDSQWEQFIDDQYSAITNALKSGAGAMGKDGGYVDAIMQSFSSATAQINLKGLDAEGQQKAIQEYFRNVTNQALLHAYPDLEGLIRLGEDAAAAFERINKLRATNNALLLQEMELQGNKGSAEYMKIINEQRTIELLTMDESTQAIQKRIWALQDEKTAVDALNSDANAAYSALQRSVNAELVQLQQNYNSAVEVAAASMEKLTASTSQLKSIVSAVTAAIDTLSPMARGDANALIRSQTGIIGSGGTADEAAISRALAALQRPTEDLFATRLEWQRDQAEATNNIAALGAVAENRLTIEQQMLDTAESTQRLLKSAFEAEKNRLDNILIEAKKQLDTLNGINTSILTLGDAITVFNASVLALATKTNQPAPTPISTAGMAVSPEAAAAAAAATAATATYTALATIVMGPNESGTYGGVSLSGGPSGATYSLWENDLTKVVRALSPGQIPSFDVGTNYVPYDMTANIHRGERIVPAADNYKLMQGSEELLAEVRMLRAEVRAVANNTAKSAKLHDQWDGDGLPETRAA